MRRFQITVAAILIVLLPFSLSQTSFAKDEKPPVNRLIVKLKDVGPHALKKCLMCLFGQNKPTAAFTEDKSSSLDKVLSPSKVKSVKALFRVKNNKVGDDIKSINANIESSLESVHSKFLKRSKRFSRTNDENKNLGHIYMVELKDNVDVNKMCAELAKDPHVEYCQPDYLFKTQSIYNPNDPYLYSYGSWHQSDYDLWNLRHINLLSDAHQEMAWDISRGDNVVVAVVDTGLDYNHAEMLNNVWKNPSEIPGNNLDDDNNGYVDDVSGWNYDASNNNPNDDFGHGTMISGIIAAAGNNSEGIIGVAPSAKIMPLKISFSLDTAYVSSMIQAIMYAVNNGADVVNLSWTPVNPTPSIPALEDVIRLAHQMGLVVVVPAGNQNDDVKNYSPANMKETVTVAGTDLSDQRAAYDGMILYGSSPASNYGYSVDVSAPSKGFLVLNSKKGGNLWAVLFTLYTFSKDYYIPKGGSSLAAAHVSGLAALLLSRNSALTNEDVRQVMRSTARDLYAPGLDVNSGFGMVDALAALKSAAPLRVGIHEPANLSTVNVLDKSLMIKGEAYGPNFKEYQLSALNLDNSSAQWVDVDFPKTKPVSGQSGDDVLFPVKLLRNLPEGNYLLRLKATALNGLSYEDSVQVNLKAINAAPAFEALGSQVVANVNTKLSFYVKALDPNDDKLTYDVTNLPQGASFSTVQVPDSVTKEVQWFGLFEWTPTFAQVGMYSVQFGVTDEHGARVVNSPTVIDVQKPKGRPPEMQFVMAFENIVIWKAKDKEDKFKELRYSYRIDGGSFSAPSKQRVLLVNHLGLKSGWHRIDVKAIDQDGLESELKSVRFFVDPFKAEFKKYKAKRKLAFK